MKITVPNLEIDEVELAFTDYMTGGIFEEFTDEKRKFEEEKSKNLSTEQEKTMPIP